MDITLYEVLKQPVTKAKSLNTFSPMGEYVHCIFNNGTDTYLHPGNESYSAINITVTDEFLLLDSSCKMQDDQCGSDHFPIIVDSLIFTVGECLIGLCMNRCVE
jgi:hypothetical protein